MNKYEENYGQELKKYESLGIKEGDILFEEEFDYINIIAQIEQNFIVTIIVKFDAKIQDHAFVWEGNTSQRCTFIIGKIELNCNNYSNVERKERRDQNYSY